MSLTLSLSKGEPVAGPPCRAKVFFVIPAKLVPAQAGSGNPAFPKAWMPAQLRA